MLDQDRRDGGRATAPARIAVDTVIDPTLFPVCINTPSFRRAGHRTRRNWGGRAVIDPTVFRPALSCSQEAWMPPDQVRGRPLKSASGGLDAKRGP
jgi:hypothetical protein